MLLFFGNSCCGCSSSPCDDEEYDELKDKEEEEDENDEDADQIIYDHLENEKEIN